MSRFANKDFLIEVEKGNIPGHYVVHKFGRNTAVGTTFVPVTRGGIYQTPQAGSANTLRIKAGGDANDTAAGTGARQITLIGLNASGAEITETLATAGESASSATSNSFIRLYRAYVSQSGTYATASAGSHAAAITIENGSGGTDWASIEANGFPKAQTEIGAYSIPTGYTAYMLAADIHADTSKTTEILLFQRPGILKTSAPYDAMRLVDTQIIKDQDEVSVTVSGGIPFAGESDVGFMAKVDAGTAQVSIGFTLLLVAD